MLLVMDLHAFFKPKSTLKRLHLKNAEMLFYINKIQKNGLEFGKLRFLLTAYSPPFSLSVL